MNNSDDGPLIAVLSKLSAADVGLVGGKAANLGELTQHGFPVPGGFVLTAIAHRLFCDHIGLADHLTAHDLADLGQLKRAAAELQELILSAEIPNTINDAIARAHRKFAPHDAFTYAVRSSATGEDSAHASFAGQHATYYYVHEHELATMIKHCWASWWSPTATVYRHNRGIEHTSGHMAVVVQEMIHSDVAGVTFTINPTNGDTKEVVTEASWGMGAIIVDGRVTPDRYVVRRADMGIVERRIANKNLMVKPELSPNEDTRLHEVPISARMQPALLDAQIVEVARHALDAESLFGVPQDIEWAYAKDRFFMLQSRPVTTMPELDEAPPAGRYVIFKPLVENFTEPLTPLTVDLLRVALPPDYTFIRGRIYADSDRQRRLFPFKVSDRQWVEYLYLAQRPDFSALPVDMLKLPLTLMAASAAYLVCGVFFARTAHLPDDFMEMFRKRCVHAISDQNVDASRALLMLSMPYGRFWAVGDMPLQVNFASARYFFWLMLVRLFVERWAPELSSDTTAILCAGSSGVKSTEMGRAISQLANEARSQPRVAEKLRTTAPASMLQTLAAEPQAQNFLKQLHGFLAEHGHRTPKEFDLSRPRWAEDPALVINMVRNYLLVDKVPDAQGQTTQSRGASVLGRVHDCIAALPAERWTHWRKYLLDYCIDRAKYFSKNRENSRHYHIMIWQVLREKILQREKHLLRTQKLKSKDDIFFLHLNEITQLDSGELQWREIEPVIHRRRLAYRRECQRTPPRTFGFDDDPVSAPLDAVTPTLTGQGASPGVYQGRARLILDLAANAELRPGEILVAPYTDPAWTPLFLTARAAVVEVGSYLSHAGTIAREYGMPCVVDVTGCTARIETGTLLSVDGSRGTVTIIEETPKQ